MVKPIHGDRRKSNRAEGYDYAEAGWYYVTVCTHELRTMFGDVVDGEMVLNSAGEIATAVWEGLPERFPLVSIDAFIVMPNHMHGIVVINEGPMSETKEGEYPVGVRAQFIAPLPQRRQTSDSPSNSRAARQGAINCARTQEGSTPQEASSAQPFGNKNPKALGNIMRVFKAVATDRVRRSGQSDFRWHHNYYDHIIRNEKDLDRIRTYITNNAVNWPHDRANRSMALKETPKP